MSIFGALTDPFALLKDRSIRELRIGDSAPVFKLLTHDEEMFDLTARKGKGWTILYFYPKADTPGCTKQTCAFRDSIDKLARLDAEVFGISVDEVEDIESFHIKHHLQFSLLSDSDAEVTKLYNVKMPVVNFAKRWTFIIDPELKIRAINKDVDPVMDATNVAEQLASLQAKH